MQLENHSVQLMYQPWDTITIVKILPFLHSEFFHGTVYISHIDVRFTADFQIDEYAVTSNVDRPVSYSLCL